MAFAILTQPENPLDPDGEIVVPQGCVSCRRHARYPSGESGEIGLTNGGAPERLADDAGGRNRRPEQSSGQSGYLRALLGRASWPGKRGAGSDALELITPHGCA